MARRWQVQATYEVGSAGRWVLPAPGRRGHELVFGARDGDRAVVVMRVRAGSAHGALALVDADVRQVCAGPGGPLRRLGADVRRLRGLSLRRRTPRRGARLPGPGGDDGSAGVREPRRPLGSPPADTVALDAA